MPTWRTLTGMNDCADTTRKSAALMPGACRRAARMSGIGRVGAMVARMSKPPP